MPNGRVNVNDDHLRVQESKNDIPFPPSAAVTQFPCKDTELVYECHGSYIAQNAHTYEETELLEWWEQ